MHDITSLVLTLALPWDVDHVNPDLDKLHAKAQALVAPFYDYEASARAAGFVQNAAGRWEDPKVGEDGIDNAKGLAEVEGYPLIEIGDPCQFFSISRERAAELEKEGFLDYEGAARAKGWSSQPDHVNFEFYAGEPSVMHEDRSVSDSSYSVTRMGWKVCCEENGIEPLRTPFRIDRDFDGLIVWARP